MIVQRMVKQVRWSEASRLIIGLLLGAVLGLIWPMVLDVGPLTPALWVAAYMARFRAAVHPVLASQLRRHGQLHAGQ